MLSLFQNTNFEKISNGLIEKSGFRKKKKFWFQSAAEFPCRTGLVGLMHGPCMNFDPSLIKICSVSGEILVRGSIGISAGLRNDKCAIAFIGIL